MMKLFIKSLNKDALKDKILVEQEYNRFNEQKIKFLEQEIERLKEVISSTHNMYCTADWTDRGLHAPECLLEEID